MFSLPIVVVVMVLKTTKGHITSELKEKVYVCVLYVKNQAIDIILELRL